MSAALDLTKAVPDGLAIPKGVRVVTQKKDLGQISNDGVAAVVLERTFAKPLQGWIDALDPAVLPTTRVILRPDDVRMALDAACREAGTPKGPRRAALIEDICALAGAVTDAMAPPFLRVRLAAVTTNSCSKFHVDAITARLVCTYRGPGTQYGIMVGGADPDTIFDVPTGAAIMLRGTRWPETPASGLRHRSPQIAGTGQARLVLVVDPIFDPDEEE